MLEAFAALAFGIWLNALHARIDRFVDSVLFRRRHLAEARLERAAKTLVHAESATVIDETLVVEPCDALALAAAAVFRADGGVFVRTSAQGWDGDDNAAEEPYVEHLTRNDRLVVTLLAELQPIDLTDVSWIPAGVPHGLRQPLLAAPFVVRHELLGFALYSGHVGGEALDPDEKASLSRLAVAAAVAYEHVNAKAMLAETERLRAQNQLLEHDRTLLERDRDLLRTAISALSR